MKKTFLQHEANVLQGTKDFRGTTLIITSQKKLSLIEV